MSIFRLCLIGDFTRPSRFDPAYSSALLCIYKYSEENSGCQIRQWAHCRCLLLPALVHGCEHLSTVKFSTLTFVLNRIAKKPLSVGSPSISLQSSPPHIKYKNELKKATLLSHGRQPESSCFSIQLPHL